MMNQNKRGSKPPQNGPFGGGPMGGGAHGDKPKDMKGTLKKLIEYLGSYKIAVVVVMVFAVASTVFGIVGPKILGTATTELYAGIMGQISGGAGVDFGKIATILLTLVVIYLVSAGFSLTQGFIMTGVSNKLTYRLRRDIDLKIHALPFRFFDGTTNGEVLSRLTNDVDAINQSFNQSITQIISSITMLIGILIMMFSISYQMTLIALATLPISVGFISFIVSKSQKHFIRQQTYLGNVNSTVEETYSCHTIVRAFNGEERAVEGFNEQNGKLYNAQWRANFLSGLMMPIMNFIGNLGYVVVCIVGATLAASGSIALGDIQAFIQYMRQFTQPISQLSQISNVIQQTFAAAERVFDFLGQQEEPQDAKDSVSDMSKVEGRITFQDVSFGYNPDQLIVHHFDAQVEPGQKIAIVGPTGAGKTTMVKLLMRFYDVNDGAILLDGTDIRQYERDALRTAFGMVLQETWLYAGTIADNIRYGKLDATDDEVRMAAKTAQIDRYIRTLPDGYQTILNEDASNISQGQKQLMTIARAILADPKILILDEATSSVDTRTEILIQRAMDALMQNRTSFIIAHRLSTIRHADLILVMNNGDIVEQGTHTELMAAQGFYAGLYNSQFDSIAG